jgi:hypothetical protein
LLRLVNIRLINMLNLENLENKAAAMDLAMLLNIDETYVSNFIGLITGCSATKVKILIYKIILVKKI